MKAQKPEKPGKKDKAKPEKRNPEKILKQEEPPARQTPAADISPPHAKVDDALPRFPDPDLIKSVDVEKLVESSTEILAETGKAGAAVLRSFESGEATSTLVLEEGADFTKTLGSIAEYWLKDPARLVRAQKDLSINMINLWSASLKEMNGEKADPVVDMPARDNRFADPEWETHPYFHFLKQAYFLGTKFANDLVEKAEDIDPHTKQKAGFYMRQLASAFSPSNFVMTNPDLMRTTLEQNGENLARGMKMLAEDIDAGKGELKIRQSDGSAFEVGVNIANTQGKVVFRNELFELIQYTPTTAEVYKTPLLIIPPWINKFYILDLNPEKSFVRWAVSQGLTVFILAWVNPDERLRAYDFTAYMEKGILTALDQVEHITGEKQAHTIGYCVGGTLLAVTLAWLAQSKRPDRVKSTTFFTTQVDFTHAGDLLTFVDEAQISGIEELMAKYGYLPGGKMAGAFNMLRPADLIWNYVVNNYLKGKQPPAFDLLFWNADSTRMAEANHSFYLRNCYLHNRLSRGEMVVGSKTLDLKKVTIPIYNLAAREDHIAPAKSVFVGSQFFGGDVTYVMAGSGHIAGVVNPVAKPKYQYWLGGPVEGTFEDWAAKAVEHPGTWWPHWHSWLTKGDKMVPARPPGGGVVEPLCDAPGEYVKVKA